MTWRRVGESVSAWVVPGQGKREASAWRSFETIGHTHAATYTAMVAADTHWHGSMPISRPRHGKTHGNAKVFAVRATLDAIINLIT